MEKKILITGANGYIGKHVVDQLIDLGVKVYAVDLKTDLVNQKAERLNADLFTGTSEIIDFIQETKTCLHLAWQDGFNHHSERHINNLPKHFQFLQSLIDHGLTHLSVMGTVHEIGYWEGKVDENTPTNPRSFYGIAKNSLRQITRLITEKNDVIYQWLRAFYILGDDLRNNSIFSKILELEKAGKETFPFTTGKNKYDFITIEQLARQISLAVIQDDVAGIINCCSGEPVSLKEKVQEFIEERNLNIQPNYGEYPERSYDSPAIWGDTTKIDKIIAKVNQ